MNPALTSLQRLRKGNARFVANLENGNAMPEAPHPIQLPQEQNPHAIILGCSDARVSPEIVFGQGLGDLFVIRVVGNIVTPSQVGSIEYAASKLGTPLVVVLGHSQCGAIQASIDELLQATGIQSSNLQFIIDRVRPAVEPLLHTELRHDLPVLARRAMRANVSASAAHLRSSSAVLEELVLNNGLMVVGAGYSVETGVVDFFDGVPHD